ncbi:PPE domain-containing protein [Mycolicibacterium tusciae]|uniref:PPE domain-containing protein n=1 Tax=Mycolicibacterium tusciae TaxID=75922 RepID=UPI00024A361B|nr:hypothetical protein [Mycolicibacterium tusciae]
MTVQRVDPTSLTGQAAEMKGQNWHSPSEDAVTPPDALPSTNDAIANLNANAQSLKEFERWAEVENQRIAEMLEIAAQAYQKVDDDYGKAIDDPERAAAVAAITIASPQTQPPEIPGPPSTPRLLDASGYSNVIQTQAELSAPDTGTSLKTAMLQWGIASNRVENNKPKPPPGDWEGEAADAAYARMTTFGNWLTQLSEAWYDLAEAASKILSAHNEAKSAHDPITKEYTELEARMRELANVTGPHGGVRVQREMERIRKRMEELQAQSDEVRREYASSATFAPVRPADPPFKPAGGLTSTGSGGAEGSGHQPVGDPAAMAQKMGESMGSPPPQSGSQQGGGAAGGSPSGGGSPPAGGGSPSGTGGETPDGTPKLPTDPGLRPAAGGSGSGGGAGGSSPASAPLSPAVTPETVAPGPPVPVGAGPASATGTPGGMAGGMGGMAPMHGAQGAQQGKEKRRDPLTAPDEDLYVEERPWTEAVIGNRRRRDVQDVKQSEQEDQ